MCILKTFTTLRPKLEGAWNAELCLEAHHAQQWHAAGNVKDLDNVTYLVGAARLHHVHIGAVV